VASEASSPAVGSMAGKNSLGSTVADTAPYRVKSNHSRAVPMVAAVTALRDIRASAGERVVVLISGTRRCFCRYGLAKRRWTGVGAVRVEVSRR